MRTKLFGLLMLCLATNLTYAQNARTILDKAADSYAKTGGVTAKFTMDIKDVKAKVTHSQDGTAHMMGNKFKIEIPEAITWFDGKTQWVYIKDNDEVNISNPSGDELLSPSILFSVYKKGFDLKYKGEKTVSGKTVQEVELTAQDKKTTYSKIIVQINKATNTFTKVVLYDTNGMESTLSINSYQATKSLSDASFVFNKKDYPSVELVDLR